MVELEDEGFTPRVAGALASVSDAAGESGPLRAIIAREHDPQKLGQ